MGPWLLLLFIVDVSSGVERGPGVKDHSRMRAFAVAITYAASFSFITPLEPACVLVYTPGRYRFLDFVKIGTILTLIVFAVSIMLVPIVWPF